ncbi:unnamed protein product [Cyclocybe aegerita]|uniref:Uncharacterized protein n=1 Tax=Cyclocybe aegerita TaxID=1973307 RepID=A0A8S0VUJ9_CYCAE|nr:unnamed protein product [Cyclocybe aegerita]
MAIIEIDTMHQHLLIPLENLAHLENDKVTDEIIGLKNPPGGVSITKSSFQAENPSTPTGASTSKTPMPTASEYIPLKTPAWDPSSCTLALSSLGPPSMVSAASIPMEDCDMSWLKDPCFKRVRAKLLEKNTVNWKALEFVSVSGDQVRVKDLQLRGERTIDIANLQPVVPDMTGDFVTVTVGPMAGKIFKVRSIDEESCTIRAAGTRPGKGEKDPIVFTTHLACVYGR